MNKTVGRILRAARRVSVVAGAALLTLVSGFGSAAELPVTCVAGSCGAGGPSQWVTSGSATHTTSGNTLTVNQTSDRAILNWASFNVSADGRVIFNQPAASSIALNRIYQSSPSRIFGQLQANGEIYLVNPNGIIFGRTAIVNAAGILATTLSISDANFAAGIASASIVNSAAAALASDGRISLLDVDGNPVLGNIDADGNITVDPNGQPIKVQLVLQEGSQLATNAANGRVLLAAQTIDNAGSIEAADGQVIMAAGEKVYLKADNDPALRGLLVEVDAGGAVWNRLTGNISTPRGNTTLVGMAVNQDGRISATTTVSANGSIKLLARDTVQFDANAGTFDASRTGTLEFGSHGTTSVLPELTDTAAAVDDQTQYDSSIMGMGHQVTIRGGSTLRAPGGRIEVSALLDPTGPQSGIADLDAQLRVENGAVIDVAGSAASLPMSRNLVTVELRASELRDSPEQRDSAIRGKSIVVDARVSTPLADVAGAIAAIPKSVAERTSKGGAALFLSDGDLVAESGSSFDVSGGILDYQSGAVQTSLLIGADGKLYDIGSADAARTYVGVVNPYYRRVDDRWGQVETIAAPGWGRIEQGYLEGKAAGTLQFAAPSMVLNGDFKGSAITGPYQRNAGSVTAGGRLVIGLEKGVGFAPNLDYRAPSVEFTRTAGQALSGGSLLQLPTNYLENGFSRTEIYSDGEVTLPEETDLQLAAGSVFKVLAQSIDIRSDIRSPGGSISLITTDTFGGPSVLQPGIAIVDGATLDVRGTWSNDFLLDAAAVPSDPILKNGGSINLALAGLLPAQLSLGDNVSLLASAGAYENRSGVVSAGRGGSINLQTGYNSNLNLGRDVRLAAFGVLGASGGSFSLTAPRIDIGTDTAWAVPQNFAALDSAGGLHIGSALFSDYGFSSIVLTANAPRNSPDSFDALQVLPGTRVDAQLRSLELSDQATRRSSGGTIDTFSSVVLPESYRRSAMQIALNVGLASASSKVVTEAGDLRLGEGAVLRADPGSSVSLSSVANLFIDGAIEVHGGSISAGIATPGSDQDAGFIADQRLVMGSGASLDASGTAVYKPNDSGLLNAKLLSGGTVSLAANRGYVRVEEGARIDVSGTEALVDVATGNPAQAYERHTVASSGGSLEVRAPEAIGLFGSVDASAGHGDTGNAAAGSLAVQLTRNAGFNALSLQNTYPTDPRVLELSIHDAAVNGMVQNGFARISQDFINGSGADAIALRADDVLSIEAGTTLSMGRSLAFDAPLFSVAGSGRVSLSAPYVSIGNSLPSDSPAQSNAGGSVLEVQGAFIDLVGSSVLDAVSTATLTSTGDIRLRGSVRQDGSIAGGLSIAGDLTLSAARVYGSTATDFTLRAAGGVNDRLSVSQVGVGSGTPLSVGASLHLEARDIVQGGTLLAPFGSISLSAENSVTLQSGSRTSVSGAGALLPYGAVTGGQWFYSSGGTTKAIDTLPSREVAISGDSVVMAPGSVVDMSGGGDLYAYEWIPGTGGSRDALAPGVVPGLYAILPSLKDQYAPYDPQEYAGSDLKPGNSIYLSGLGDLAAGNYPLLPARYALLPGAYLVSAVAGSDGIAPGAVTSLADGTRVVAGYLTFGATQLGSGQYSGFAIRPGSYGRAIASYDDFYASSFLAQRAARLELGRVTLPVDAGALSLFAGSQLDARGSVLTQAASGGVGATIDISALRLAVTGSAAAQDPTEVQIGADQLQAWNPSRLLLGGHRIAGSNDEIDVTAEEVDIASGAHLALDEIVIAGRQRVGIAAGVTLASRSGVDSSIHPQLAAAPPSLQLSADNARSAVVAVSDLAQLLPGRAAAIGAGGTINIDAGATMASHGAITLDAPGGASIEGSLQGAGARISLGADRVVFSDAPQAGALSIDAGVQSQLQSAAALRFSASNAIDFARGVAIELTPVANSAIELAAPQLNAVASGISVEFSADRLTLAGGLSSGLTPSAGDGLLQLSADTLELGAGAMDVNGFAHSVLTGHQAVMGRGKGQFGIAGNLDVAAPLLTVASDADTGITVTGGTARLQKPGSAGTPFASALQLGGSLSLSANRIEDSTAILAPSGLVSLQADGDLLLLDGASIDVAGRTVSAGGRQVGSNGGSVRLAAGGDLNTAESSSIGLSGAGDSSAGRLSVRAGAAASLLGSLSAQADSASRGGSFDLYAQSLNDFGALNAKMQGGGFTHEQRVHLGSGDLSLGATQQMAARSVELVTDGGLVQIGGTVSATDVEGGSIRLYGSNGVTLGSSAQLHADASSTGTRGGSIELGTSTGSLDLAPGGVVSAAGSSGNGVLKLRAPIVGNDVAITQLAADLSQAGSVVVAPVVSFDVASSAPTAADFTGYFNGADSFVAASAATIRGRLGNATASNLLLRPDIELRYAGDLTLPALDLSAWRFDGQPGTLTVRAGGSVQVDGRISDGFLATGAGNNQRLDLLAGASSSINIVAGADLASVDPTTTPNTASDLVMGAGAIVRTGTGTLRLSAARDLIFNTGAAVYTGGLQGSPSQAIQAATTLTVLTSFPDQGGSVELHAGRDIVGSAVSQSVSTWQFRGTRASPSQPVARLYGINAARFGWNVGTLGGGDVTVNAGHDVIDLSAAAADSGLVGSDGVLTQFGGGSIAVTAAHDIDSSMFYGARGSVSLYADNAVSSARNSDSGDPLGTLLALGNAQATIEARRDILLERVFDPGVLNPLGTAINRRSFFFSSGDDSALRVQSAAGNVSLLAGNPNSLSAYVEPDVATGTPSVQAFAIYPNSLTARAYTGDLLLGDRLNLKPSGTAQLDLFAYRDIVAAQSGGIGMSDGAAAGIPTVLSPQIDSSVALNEVLKTASASIHLNDSLPVVMTAGRDIVGGTYELPKSATIVAGRDIFDATIFAQNLHDSDLTLIGAGRDIRYPAATQLQEISVGGPGRLDVLAGRNVDLGFTRGITTTGRLRNASLPVDSGADITVMAGFAAQPDYAGFVDDIVATSQDHRQGLIDYVALVTGSTSPFDAALTTFGTFDAQTQRPFIDRVFFNELVFSGREANSTPNAGFARGYAAIDALFPGSRGESGSAANNPYAGDLNMSFSRIYSLAGGDISLLIPGGQLNVGLANPPPFVSGRKASELGIVAQRDGNIDIFTSGDVLVNQSRIFTLLGGDIAVWSTHGDIDAGRGAKSSLSAPAPTVLIDTSGRVSLNFSDAVAGSGIRTIVTAKDVEPGDVDLIAPAGFINAGDAGIGSAGNLNIAAQHVIGLDNIQVGGTSTGVPAETGGLGAALAGVSGVASSASNAAGAALNNQADTKNPAPMAQSALSWLDVFVIGLGEDNCKQDDLDCLKRQR